MLEGNLAMFKSALAILKMIEPKILSTTECLDPNELFEESLLLLGDTKTFKKLLISVEFEEHIILNKKIAMFSQAMGKQLVS
jgi:hypothetical protein